MINKQDIIIYHEKQYFIIYLEWKTVFLHIENENWSIDNNERKKEMKSVVFWEKNISITTLFKDSEMMLTFIDGGNLQDERRDICC